MRQELQSWVYNRACLEINKTSLMSSSFLPVHSNKFSSKVIVWLGACSDGIVTPEDLSFWILMAMEKLREDQSSS
jgi:hypothetical protein